MHLHDLPPDEVQAPSQNEQIESLAGVVPFFCKGVLPCLEAIECRLDNVVLAPLATLLAAVDHLSQSYGRGFFAERLGPNTGLAGTGPRRL